MLNNIDPEKLFNTAEEIREGLMQKAVLDSRYQCCPDCSAKLKIVIDSENKTHLQFLEHGI